MYFGIPYLLAHLSGVIRLPFKRDQQISETSAHFLLDIAGVHPSHPTFSGVFDCEALVHVVRDEKEGGDAVGRGLDDIPVIAEERRVACFQISCCASLTGF
jgi:hypothetical protein